MFGANVADGSLLDVVVFFERVENEFGGGADVVVSRRMAAFRSVKKEDVAADFLKRFGEAFRGVRRNDFVATAQRKRRRFID